MKLTRDKKNRLDRMIENGSFYALPFRYRYALIRRVEGLHGARALLAGAATLALAACPPVGSNNPAPPTPPAPKADNPSFAAPSKNPFGFVPPTVTVPGPLAPAFADVNGDGNADLFAGAGGESAGIIAYYANVGSKTAPSFAAPADFLNLPSPASQSDYGPLPVLAPLRGGVLWDVLIGQVHAGALSPVLQFYQNDGSSFSTPGVPAALPAGASSSITATVVDINGDGLLDVFESTTEYDTNTQLYVNKIEYFKNTGTASAPAFTDQGTTLGLVLPEGSYGYPTFVDINADGTFDAFVGNENGDIFFFKNIGTPTAPQFAAPVKNPLGFTPVPVGPAVPAFVDIDHDGDFDLFVGDGNGDLWFYKNANF